MYQCLLECFVQRVAVRLGYSTYTVICLYCSACGYIFCFYDYKSIPPMDVYCSLIIIVLCAPLPSSSFPPFPYHTLCKHVDVT